MNVFSKNGINYTVIPHETRNNRIGKVIWIIEMNLYYSTLIHTGGYYLYLYPR